MATAPPHGKGLAATPVASITLHALEVKDFLLGRCVGFDYY